MGKTGKEERQKGRQTFLNWTWQLTNTVCMIRQMTQQVCPLPQWKLRVARALTLASQVLSTDSGHLSHLTLFSFNLHHRELICSNIYQYILQGFCKSHMKVCDAVKVLYKT